MSKEKKPKKRKTKRQKALGVLKSQIVLAIIIIAAIAYYYAGGYANKISDMKNQAQANVAASSRDTFKSTQTSIAYDSNGEIISILKGDKDVYYVPYDDIPIYAIQAMIAVEDKRFYDHHGVDYRGIVRAVWAMIRNGQVTQGGSTITQQLARNIFLTQDQSWERKIEEIYTAVELEKKYGKQDILEFYMNNIYFGNGYYGIQAASKGYFNCTVGKLSLSQIAFLCAIPNSPTNYDPVLHMNNTLERRDRILEKMRDEKKISEDNYLKAVAEKITLQRPKSVKNNYAETFLYYCATRTLMAVEGFEFKYDFESEEKRDAYDLKYQQAYKQCNQKLYTGGYRIFTSLDMGIQEQLQNAVDEGLEKYDSLSDEGVYELQGAAVCIDNKTGMVKAAVGGRSQDLSGYTLNRAYQSFRQPGSAIKPLLVYTPALERGYTADTKVVDEKIEGGPKNADGSYMGRISLRTAVALSRNTVAWRLLDEISPAEGLKYLKAMGFSKISKYDDNLTSALGGFTTGVSAYEMASGYATLANDGNYRNPNCILKITDAQGNEIYRTDVVETVVYKSAAAREMTDILKSVISSGTGKGLGIGEMPVVGKTGTTNNNYDGWFCGYSPYYTTSVWVGYDLPQKLPGLSGSTYPGTIWKNFMSAIHENLPVIEFLEPMTYDETEQNNSPEQGAQGQNQNSVNEGHVIGENPYGIDPNTEIVDIQVTETMRPLFQ